MKSSKQSATNDELICEQIDVVVMGSKAFQLLEVLLDRDLNLVSMPVLKNKYLNSLSSLLPSDSNLGFKPTTKYPGNSAQNKIQIYTTTILTQSFWLQFNFFYLGALLHDPLLGPISRNKIPLCIMACPQQQADNPVLKSLLSSSTPTPQVELPGGQQNKSPSRLQQLMQHKIISSLHSLKLNNFGSVLSLNFIDANRIVESSSGFKLGRNQILRWIVQHYFQDEFGVKIRGEIGDEVENLCEPKPGPVCTIM